MAEEPTRKLAVLLHADVVGSTTLVRLDETLAHRRIQDTFRRFAETIAAHDGVTHEIRGDALVAEFSRASDAIEAALTFQTENSEHLRALCDEIRPQVRVGVAMGEVVVADGTVTGEGIVLAQRLEQLAEPGSLCVQGAACETVPKRLPFVFTTLGDLTLKGFDEPVKAYAVTRERHGMVAETNAALPGSGTGFDLSDKPSIAVLPFNNMSGDPEQEYFSDGITEDIITELTRFRSLAVIGRNSSFTYKGRTVGARQLADELGVQFVVEGSVRKAGNRVRINAQLTDAATGAHVWAERYDRQLEDIFAVQDEVTQAIVATIANRLQQTEARIAARKKPGNMTAYDYFLRGLQHYNTVSEEGLIEARRLFCKAIELDADYVRAYAYLGLSIFVQIFYTYTGTDDLEDGFRAGTKALSIDSDEPLAHAAVGLLHFTKGQDEAAIASLERAVALNPNDPQLSQGLGFVLTYVGRPEQGTARLEAARRLNPLEDATVLGISLYLGNRYEEATEIFREVGGYRWSGLYLAAALGQLGRSDEAQSAFRRFADYMQSEFRERGDEIPTAVELVQLDLQDLRRPGDREHLIEGLRKAGLPEYS